MCHSLNNYRDAPLHFKMKRKTRLCLFIVNSSPHRGMSVALDVARAFPWNFPTDAPPPTPFNVDVYSIQRLALRKRFSHPIQVMQCGSSPPSKNQIVLYEWGEGIQRVPTRPLFSPPPLSFIFILKRFSVAFLCIESAKIPASSSSWDDVLNRFEFIFYMLNTLFQGFQQLQISCFSGR